MIFSRYLAKEFIKINLSMNTLFLGFYCFIDFLDQNTRYFPKYKVGWKVILEYYLSQLPKIFIDMLPFTVLFSTIIVLWVFSRSGEISAVRAVGRSVFGICTPLIVLGATFTLINLAISEFVVPKSARHLRMVETVKIKKIELEEIYYQSRWIHGNQAVLNFKSMDPVYRVLEQPQYYEYYDSITLKTFAYADTAIYDQEKSSWVLNNAVITNFDKSGRIKNSIPLSKMYTFVTYQPPKLLREQATSDQVSFMELRNLIQLSKKAGGELSDRDVDLQMKLSLPFANLLFVFLAMPFAIRKERQADAYFKVVLCLIVAIVYWVGNISMRSLAQNGNVNPIIAAWLMNLILLVVSILLVSKLEKGS